MLQPNGQRMLEIIGKHTASEPSAKGILLPEEMPQALTALQAAMAQEEALHQEAIHQAQVENLPAPRFDAIGLRQRALPFMDMVRECIKANEAIVWGV